jgi:D-glycero-alpha-D-manno-heptose-7-phosphate kinase
MEAFSNFHVGAVVSTAINKYIYISVNPKFDGRFRVSYSQTENVDTAEEIQHDIIRESLKLFQVKGLEIVSVSDIPGGGSGLGSSSAFTVGLLRALYAYCDYKATPRALAEHAFALEGEVCGHPVGRQDHYAAAYGGFNFYEFKKDRVTVNGCALTDGDIVQIGSRLMLFWTGSRAENSSQDILKEQSIRISPGHGAEDSALLMAELAQQMKAELLRKQFGRIGKFVKSSWVLKKHFSPGVSNDRLDQSVANALRAGADGAKISGAGGGGFLLVVSEPGVRNDIEQTLGLRRLPLQIGARGSTVIWTE